ncbi:MAG TPA: HTTM domain-containing protein [Candidatus Kryptonia bacterium]|nr:HTTM domain-containing protein [Candidatus Kryptonia bacterium]
MFGWLLYVIVNYHRSFAGLVSIPLELRVPPPGYEWLLPRTPIDIAYVIVVRRVAVVFGTLAFVGLFTRTSAFITSGCAFYLLGIEELFGKIYHQYQHLIWFAMLLAVSPSGDALAIDALWARWRRAQRGETSPSPSAVAYALPLRFVWLLIGVIYFFPGLAKLRAGPEWILSDNLKNLMYWYWSKKHFVPWFRIDHYPFVCHAAALATIVFEISFIACVFSRRLRPLLVVAGVLFHWMTAKYLGLVFWSLVVCYTALVDWDALLRRLGFNLAVPTSTPRRVPLAVVIVGSLLLTANICCGAFNIDSWPFCIYPRFSDIVRTPTRRFLEVVARSAGGELRPTKIDIPEGVENRIVAAKDPTDRARLLNGLRALIERRRKLAPGASVLVFEVERSTVPEQRASDPLRRELLLEVRAER